MVKELESNVLKSMDFSELKKHVKVLKKAGYKISGVSSLKDTGKDREKLRKLIRNSQKAGKKSKSSPKSSPSSKSSKSKQSNCDTDFDNNTHCMKRTSIKKVRELAEECGIKKVDEKTKPQLCDELLKKQGKKSNSSKKKSSSKKKEVSIRQTEAYKELDKKFPRKSVDGKDLLDIADKLKIKYAKQDGESLNINKVRKHGIIVAILEKTGGKVPSGKKSKKKTTPKKSEKKTTPKKSKKKTTPKKSKKKTTPKKSKKKTAPKKSKKTCDGMTEEEFVNMKIKEKSKLLTKKGLKKGLPKSSKEMFGYLCSAEENGRCDPEKGKWCEGEFICDASNSPGVCISPSQVHSKLEEWDYHGKKIVASPDVLKSIKSAMKKKRKKTKKKLPDPSSDEGLERDSLLNKVSIATGRPKSFYKEWSTDNLRDRLEGFAIETQMAIAKSQAQEEADHRKEARRIMINQIIAITGEKPSDYEEYDFDELYNRYIEIKSIGKPSNSISGAVGKPIDEEEKDEEASSSDEEEDDEESSSDEEDKPGEGTEIVDIEATLTDVIAGGKKIGELAKVQQSILKCLGLLS